MGKTYKSKTKMTYHGRSCRPRIHTAKTSNRKFIMIRKKGGGTKRLYLNRQGNVPAGHRE